jgi:stage V sporulation protein R
MTFSTELPPDLQAMEAEVVGYARAVGLDFPEIRFVMLNADQINRVAAYDGFPIRYRHWRFGMEYERLRKSYDYGLHRIYEMVINTDPCYAYLLASNLNVDQKLVMAHVTAHADFFKNNLWFAHTNRRMLDDAANHATRIRRYIDQAGIAEVESFIDRCLSLDNLIDIHAPGIQRPVAKLEGSQETEQEIGRLPSKGYMEPFINPPEFLQQEQAKRKKEQAKELKFPANPQRDVLLFLLEYAPLTPWQQDVLSIIREEAYYFAPQRQTKIMNEGWATFWHSRLMTRYALQASELIDYADHHSGVVATAPGRLNPYKMGVEIFKDIEDRWDRGAFGPEYEACEDHRQRQQWDRQLGEGIKKLFEVRRIYNDVGFIDEFLTPEFAQRHKLFSFRYERSGDHYVVESREFAAIKRRLLFQLTNFGDPIIEVTDANYENRGELYLTHLWEEVDLRLDYTQATLENLQALWNRPVHIETYVSEKGKTLFSFNGKQHQSRLLQSGKVG